MRAATVAPDALLASVLLLLASGRAAAEPGRTSSLSWLCMPGADACIATQALARSVPPGRPARLRGYTVLLLPSPAERDGARGTFDTLYVGGSLCPTLRFRLVVGMLCAGGQRGAMRSHAETKDRGIEEKTLPPWNLAAEARASFPLLPPSTITAGVTGILPLLRPTFEYTPSTPGAAPENLHKVSPLAVTADLGWPSSSRDHVFIIPRVWPHSWVAWVVSVAVLSSLGGAVVLLGVVAGLHPDVVRL